MEIDKVFQSKTFKWVLFVILCLIILFFVLKLGIFIGSRRADFAFKWSENYHKNFAGPRGGFIEDLIGGEKRFMDAYGVFGEIIRIEGQALVTNDKDGMEKIVLINNQTIIREQRKDLEASDLKVGDNIIVVGEPNDSGQIEARLIRIMPPLPKEFKFFPMKKIQKIYF